MQGRRVSVASGALLLLGLLAAGCDEDRAGPPAAEPPPELGARFDPAATGTIEGRLSWEGDVPVVPPFSSPSRPMAEPPRGPNLPWDNPNAPTVDAASRGVGDAAVFLRGVEPARSRPWDLGPTRVEQRAYRLHVRQDGRDSRVGFVRRGGSVEMLSTDEHFYILQGRGAAFFSLPFPDPDHPCPRTLTRNGVVELSSGSGQFWMRAYLLVSDHPYCTRTDAKGRFRLPQVPDGEYELVFWLPNWHAVSRQRDPNTTLVARLSFRPAVELVRKVSVRRGRVTRADAAVGAAAFAR